MEQSGEGEEHAVGDLVRRDGVNAFVHGLRLLDVSPEAYERELGPGDEAAVTTRRDPDGASEQVAAERVDEAAQPELRGDVRRGVLVRT